MVMFFDDEYSSENIYMAIKQYLNTEFVQTASAQIETGNHVQRIFYNCAVNGYTNCSVNSWTNA